MALKAPYDQNQERIFNDLVIIPTGYSTYIEKGMNFVKLTDKKTGKSYQILIKEINK